MNENRQGFLRMTAVVLAVLIMAGLVVVLGRGNPKEGTMAKESRTWQESEEDLRARLTEMQYRVTQEDGTEPPFHNEYWDNKEEGIYVDVVSGEPLFSSLNKYNSGTGWPSFTRPLYPENIREETDRRYGTTRIEVRSSQADAHLGHVFKDGPSPGGLRYCINSAALRFIPKEKLQEEGYGEYLGLFE